MQKEQVHKRLTDCQTRHYLRGINISGEWHDVGSVRRFLAVFRCRSWYVLLANANGNVAEYISGSNGNITAYLDETGAIVAEYTYDPFGATIAQSGSHASHFPHRFSTKFHDTETGLYYYGYRFYDPIWSRWINRDPVEEDGGLNLYAFCGNDAVNAMDLLGMWKIERSRINNWAYATAEQGDTFQSLAELIRLEYSERTKWLKFGRGFVSESDEAKIGCRYGIPNTVAVYTSKKTGVDYFLTALVNTFRQMAKDSGANYEAKSYKVIYKLAQSSEDTFIDLWTTDGLFAYAFGGHGAGDDGKWYGYVAEPDSESAVSPDQVSPPYRLQAVGAYTCGSAEQIIAFSLPWLPGQPQPTMSWRDHVSSLGTFVGYYGAVNWLNVWWNEEAIKPGEIPD